MLQEGVSFVLFLFKHSSYYFTFKNNFIVPKVLHLLWKLPRLKPSLYNSHTCSVAHHQTMHPPCHAYNLYNKHSGEGSWGQIIRVRQTKKWNWALKCSSMVHWQHIFYFFGNSCKKQFPVKNCIKYIIEGKQVFIAVSCTLLLSSIS